jgi:hypothetical protein
VTRDRGSDTFAPVRMLALTALSLVAACRFGFEAAAPPQTETPDAAVDAPIDMEQEPPPPPTRLGCTPERFTIGAVPQFVTAVATRRGYDVFVVDANRRVTGYAYRFAMGKLELVPGTGVALPVPEAVGPVGALAVAPDAGDSVDVVISVTYELASVATTTTGTVVIPLDAQLQRVDAPGMATMTDGIEAGPGALAVDRGSVAFVGRMNDGRLGLLPVSRRGVADPGGIRFLDSRGNNVEKPSLVRATAGYLATWGDDSMPNAVIASVLDDSLAPQPPVIVNQNPDHGSYTPAAAYLASSDRYLFAWMEKPGPDFIKLTMRNGQLRDAPGAIDLGKEGTEPVVVAGDGDFLVAWKDPTTLPRTFIAAARVAADGSFKPLGINNTGGDALAFDLVVHNGQPALVWIEKALVQGDDPTLRFDALCE